MKAAAAVLATLAMACLLACSPERLDAPRGASRGLPGTGSGGSSGSSGGPEGIHPGSSINIGDAAVTGDGAAIAPPPPDTGATQCAGGTSCNATHPCCSGACFFFGSPDGSLPEFGTCIASSSPVTTR